jgi:pimeloyl-ACP methyl ester carboxylesterase
MRELIYPVPPVAVPSPAPPPLVDVALAAAGRPVAAWSLRAAAPAAALMLYFHGNGENLETLRQAGLLDEISGLGVDLLAIDYPGYGRSAGEPSEAANLAAAEAALAWARRERAGRQIVACGWSLGAAVAIQLAAGHPGEIDRLVLMSPWSSLPELAKEHYPGFMVAALLRERYDSVAAAAAVRCPTLVVHGTADTIIPLRHGQAVAAALGGHARLAPVAGAGHNDLLGVRRTWQELARFLARG